MIPESRSKHTMSYFNDWIGFKLTKEQFVQILKENPRLEADINEMGADTCNRESFMSALGIKITGKDWPTGGTSNDESRQFFLEMKLKGKALGYDIPDNYDEN